MQILGVDGRAAILREVAKGLHMPVDEIIPSREKLAYSGKIQARAQEVMAQQEMQQGTPTQPDGSPKGGMDGNVVNNRSAGAA
jgi:hypothetical protein